MITIYNYNYNNNNRDTIMDNHSLQGRSAYQFNDKSHNQIYHFLTK